MNDVEFDLLELETVQLGEPIAVIVKITVMAMPNSYKYGQNRPLILS